MIWHFCWRVRCFCWAAVARRFQQARKGKVQGKVTYKGTAVPVGSTVNFVHGETALPASGVTAADGTYTLRMRGGPRRSAGKYLISVIPPPTQTATAETDMAAYKAMMEGGAGAAKATTGPFPAKYQAAETSGLTFEVKEGPNTFDLHSKDGT